MKKKKDLGHCAGAVVRLGTMFEIVRSVQKQQTLCMVMIFWVDKIQNDMKMGAQAHSNQYGQSISRV